MNKTMDPHFEAWARKMSMDLEYRNIPGVGKFYECPRTLLAFEAWQASRATTPPQPIFDEANERQLFEDSMIADSEEAGFGEPDLYRDSGGCYRQPYHQAAWGGWIACAQYRAKAGEVGHE